MMLFFALVTLAVAVHTVQKENPVVNETIDFLRGFGLGLEAEFSKNLTDCVDEENQVLSDFALAFHLLRRGFDHVSINDMEKGLREMGQGLTEIRRVLGDCGFEEGLLDVERIAKKLQEGPIGWLYVLASELVNILSHHKELGHFLRTAIKDFDDGDYYLAGLSTGCFTAILIEDNPDLASKGFVVRAKECKKVLASIN